VRATAGCNARFHSDRYSNTSQQQGRPPQVVTVGRGSTVPGVVAGRICCGCRLACRVSAIVAMKIERDFQSPSLPAAIRRLIDTPNSGFSTFRRYRISFRSSSQRRRRLARGILHARSLANENRPSFPSLVYRVRPNGLPSVDGSALATVNDRERGSVKIQHHPIAGEISLFKFSMYSIPTT